jgi:hypothetical protein
MERLTHAGETPALHSEVQKQVAFGIRPCCARESTAATAHRPPSPLPGCLTQGETKEEIQQNLLEAIELWFEAGEAAEERQSGSQVLELTI